MLGMYHVIGFHKRPRTTMYFVGSYDRLSLIQSSLNFRLSLIFLQSSQTASCHESIYEYILTIDNSKNQLNYAILKQHFFGGRAGYYVYYFICYIHLIFLSASSICLFIYWRFFCFPPCWWMTKRFYPICVQPHIYSSGKQDVC